MTARPRRRFFRSVYLYGVLLLSLVAVGVFAAQAALGPNENRLAAMRLLEYVSRHLADARQDPRRFQRELTAVSQVGKHDLTVFEAGRPVASNVDPPLAPLELAEIARLAAGVFDVPNRRGTYAMPFGRDPAAYLIVRHESPRLFPRAAVMLAAILLGLGIVSIPMARAMAAPLERLGRAARALGAGDLSARAGLRRNDEIGDLALAFDEAAGKLERLILGEKQLLANVSHELRTPVTRIRLALDILAEDVVGEVAEMVRGIVRDLSELERLIEDILTSARLDLAASRASGAALPLRLGPVDPGELLRSASARFRSAHPGRILEVSFDEPLPEIRGDVGLLRRTLENLLDNAGKYSDAGTAITLRAAARSGALGVDIQDRGIGVDDGDLPRLFTPFFRTDRSRARGARGVGLGLTLSRRIIEAHGGRIAVQSAPGEGTTVHFEIPTDGGASAKPG